MTKLNRDKNINTKAYWNERYFKIKDNIPAIPSVDNFFRFDFLPKDEEFTALDIGCGTATHYPAIHAKFPKVKFTGADISSFATVFNKKHYKFAEFLDLDIEKQELTNVYDYVISAHTFEHLNDPIAATEKCIKVARKQVIICVPYKDSWSYEQEHMHTFSEAEPYDPKNYIKHFVEWDEANKVGAIYYVFEGKAK